MNYLYNIIYSRREENSQPSHIRLPDSITLVSRTATQPTTQQRQRESVTDMLANRGITVCIDMFIFNTIVNLECYIEVSN